MLFALSFLLFNWQCEDPRCHVWQHIGCVILPEKPMEGNPPVPDLFYCELCRLSRADPYVSLVLCWAWLACYLIPLSKGLSTHVYYCFWEFMF